MPTSNVLFESGAFESSTLLLAYANAPFSPGPLMSSSLFDIKGIETTKAVIEFRNDTLAIVPASPRGGPGILHQSAKRNLIEFETCQLKKRNTIMADTFQNVRGFGDVSLTSIERERNRVLTEMKADIGATVEYHQVRALSGQILDADGSVILDLLAEFGVLQQTLSLDLNVDSTNVRNKIVAAKRASESVLGAASPISWACYASASFMDALTSHPAVEAPLAGWLAARDMRDDVRSDFDFANVRFTEMRNFAGVTTVEDGAAYLVPEGIPGLFLTRFSPADYIETVNTEGQGIYVKAEPLPFNRGVMLEAQANPVSIVTRPRAVIKLTA
jgi:hypothetical protein